MSVELRDDLILPSGGTKAANLAQSHFERKNQSIESTWVYDQEQEKKHAPTWVALCLQHVWSTVVLFKDIMVHANG